MRLCPKEKRLSESLLCAEICGLHLGTRMSNADLPPTNPDLAPTDIRLEGETDNQARDLLRDTNKGTSYRSSWQEEPIESRVFSVQKPSVRFSQRKLHWKGDQKLPR